MARNETSPPKPVLVPFLVTVVLFSLVAVVTLAPPTRLLRRLHRVCVRPVVVLLGRIPVPAALEPPSNLAVSIRSFAAYAHDQQRALDRKRLAYERMSSRHRRIGDRLGWKSTLARAEDAVELNTAVTDELAAIGLDLAKRQGVPYGFRSKLHKEAARVVETLKHFVRDWSDEGESERNALFPPVLEALEREFPSDPLGEETSKRKVLVPGCGLGRLAYEIARKGFSTIGNDFSHFMTLGTSLVFSRTHTRYQHRLSPYVHSFSHHRTSDNLLRAVSFPDVVPDKHVDLLFEQGDFLSQFQDRDDTFDAIVTLFFIDTASNLLDYFETIWKLLRPDGIWINEGPLLYYGNPAMELPMDEVIKAAECVGFNIERRDTLKEIRYTADDKGMYTFAYDCEFWIARKPSRAGERKE